MTETEVSEMLTNPTAFVNWKVSSPDLLHTRKIHKMVTDITDYIRAPLEKKQKFEQALVKPPTGILMTGPPGCGKSTVGRGILEFCDNHQPKIPFFLIKSSEILDRDESESEKNLTKLFELARQLSPSVLFIDEIDGLCARREVEAKEGSSRVLTTFLQLLDGVASSGLVFLIGATNSAQFIDQAMRRTGRLDVELMLGLPAHKDREELLSCFASTWKGFSDELRDSLAGRTNGYSVADIAGLCQQAFVQSLLGGKAAATSGTEDVTVSAEHFEKAFDIFKPSSSR